MKLKELIDKRNTVQELLGNTDIDVEVGYKNPETGKEDFDWLYNIQLDNDGGALTLRLFPAV